MNTDEMIEVMQAYVRGEEIEISDADKDEWEDIKKPSWNWMRYNYRVKPKKQKVEFKVGDVMVNRSLEGFNMDCQSMRHIFEIIEINDGTYRIRNLTEGFTDRQPIKRIKEEYINADDVLWYWEFKMSDGWHISQTRMTRSQARAFVGESVDIAPLHALGFRIKDEK